MDFHSDYFPIVFVVGISALLIPLVIWFARRLQKESVTSSGTTYQSLDTNVWWAPPNAPSYYILKIKTDLRIKLAFYKKKLFHRIIELVGLAPKIRTGDKNFDDQIFIICKSPAVKTLLVNNSELRQLLLDILQNDYLHWLGRAKLSYRNGKLIYVNNIVGFIKDEDKHGEETLVHKMLQINTILSIPELTNPPVN